MIATATARQRRGRTARHTAPSIIILHPDPHRLARLPTAPVVLRHAQLVVARDYSDAISAAFQGKGVAIFADVGQLTWGALTALYLLRRERPEIAVYLSEERGGRAAPHVWWLP
jgi:hypothetical protein